MFNKKLQKDIEGLSSEAMPILMGYAWPGNIRELENVIERALLLAKGRWITPEDLPSRISTESSYAPSFLSEENLSIRKASSRLERDLIRKALELTKGNRTQASRILEISRPKLLRQDQEERPLSPGRGADRS
jgi:two-component system, NtrC family, response regulator AtoC